MINLNTVNKSERKIAVGFPLQSHNVIVIPRNNPKSIMLIDLSNIVDIAEFDKTGKMVFKVVLNDKYIFVLATLGLVGLLLHNRLHPVLDNIFGNEIPIFNLGFYYVGEGNKLFSQAIIKRKDNSTYLCRRVYCPDVHGFIKNLVVYTENLIKKQEEDKKKDNGRRKSNSGSGKDNKLSTRKSKT